MLFRETVVESLARLGERFAQAGLEVLKADEAAGEFLIADDPAPSVKAGHLGTSPLGGVPWGKADAFAMPLGPRHVIAVGPRDQWQRVGAAPVDRCNWFQLTNAVNQVAYRPGSGVREWIDGLRSGSASI